MTQIPETQATEAPADTGLLITKERLREWQACADGFGWFVRKFPKGGEYGAVQAALRADRRYSDSNWLVNQLFDEFAEHPGLIEKVTNADVEQVLAEVKPDLDGISSKLAASGSYSTLAASGSYSKLAASGSDSTLAASGSDSTLAASGSYSTLAASGSDSTLAASGSDSTLAASGSDSTLAASGSDSTCVAAAIGCMAKAGPNGCIALADHDGKRVRMVVGYVGEDIKEGVFYRAEGGKLVEVEQ